MKSKYNITKILLEIRRCLSDDLLSPEYRDRYRETKTAGHCYVATEALYHLLNKKDQEKYKPYYLKWEGTTHWFLMSKDKTEILDPTYDQFKGLPDYNEGTRCGFLTKNPSKRTITLLDRIKDI